MNKKLTYLISAALVMSTLSTQAATSGEVILKNSTTSITTGSQLVVNTYEGKGFAVEFHMNNQWLGGFNGGLILKNTSDEPLEDWALAFDMPCELSDVWGAQILRHEGSHYVLKDVGWNKAIAAGGSIHIGFNGVNSEGEEISAPQTYTLLKAKEEISSVACAIDFKPVEIWQDGLNGEINIHNTTDETIEDWVLAFDFEGEIESFWSADIISHEDNHYMIKNKGHNASISPNQTLTLGFMAKVENMQVVPTHYELGQIGKVYEEEIDYEKDTDADEIPDYYENIIGTNSNKADTDEDGLPDGYEFFVLGTSPLLKDTDENGIEDGVEDLDQDGLSNIEEYQLGANPKDQDTDGDGLLDGEEIYTYHTNPLLKDTDGDSLDDGHEIEFGFNPLVADTDSNGIIDGEEKVKQTLRQTIVNSERPGVTGVVVTAKCPGVMDEVINIRDTYNEDIISSKMPGLIGVPLQIKADKAFEAATLTFEYDESLLGDTNEADLSIIWYDEALDAYKLLDKVNTNDLAKHEISGEITQPATYLLVDCKKWQQDYTKEEQQVEAKAYMSSSLVTKSMTTQKAVAPMLYAAASSTEVDSDYDGRVDSEDSNPNNNGFSGTLYTGLSNSKVSYNMDYREFFKPNTSYSKKISTISSLYAAVIYEGSTFDGQNIRQFMSANGLTEIERYNLAATYSDSDVSEAYIGHRKVTYNGETREVIAIVVRGTNGTIQEWTSNFDIGNTTKKSSYPDWKVTSNHKGFDVAATRILKCLTSYESSHSLDAEAKKVYWVTGHSRGAGIANIIGARLIDASKYVYTYTFAAPNTTTAKNAGNYAGIYNILNEDDFVPYLPMNAWGFTHYGKSAVVSIADDYEKEWEDLTGCKNRFGVVDYNIDAIGMNDTLKAFSDVVENRNECYTYSCKCHGDGSQDNISIKNYGMSKKSREQAITKIPQVALPYCKITRYDGGFISGWDFKVCQQPEYFMQILAAYMAGEIDEIRFVVELDIAERYEKAKTGIIKSGLGGIEHPHYPESYYLLSTHITASSF